MKSVGKALDNTFTDHNPYLITGTAPSIGITKAKNALEALKMVLAMKAQKAALATQKIKSIQASRLAAAQRGVATRRANGSNVGGRPAGQTSTFEEIPNIENYLELYDTYNMTRASRLNLNNVLDKLSEAERADVLKIMMSNPSKYLHWAEGGSNITPQRAGNVISLIRRKLPGEYTPLRVQSLDQTKFSMRSGLGILTGGDATRKTAGFKRTTGSY